MKNRSFDSGFFMGDRKPARGKKGANLHTIYKVIPRQLSASAHSLL